jgi:GTPase SAR1 family protein
MRRYADDEAPKAYHNELTDHKIRTIDIDNKSVRLNIWPSGLSQHLFRFHDNGMETFFKTKSANAVMLAVDLTDKDLESNVKSLVANIRRCAGDNIPIILVGTKSDLLKEASLLELKKQELYRLINKFGLCGSFVTSAKDNTNVDEAFEFAARCGLYLAEQLVEKYRNALKQYLRQVLQIEPREGKIYQELMSIYNQLQQKKLSVEVLKGFVADVKKIIMPTETSMMQFLKETFTTEADHYKNLNAIFDDSNNLKVNVTPPVGFLLKKSSAQQNPNINSASTKMALLDVDGTLIIKRTLNGKKFSGINKTLIDQLKKDNIKDVILFTNMSATDIEGWNNILNKEEGCEMNWITRKM